MSAPLSIHVGETAEMVLPYSEVCMHMRVAGERRNVKLVSERAAQILNEDGSPFSAPITPGEAGIYVTGTSHTGLHFYHYGASA